VPGASAHVGGAGRQKGVQAFGATESIERFEHFQDRLRPQFRRAVGDTHWRTAQNLFELADALVAAGRGDAAAGLLREFEAVGRQAAGADGHLARACAARLEELEEAGP